MLATLWLRLNTLGSRLREERGDGLINWIVIAVGLAAAAAAVIALLRPAIHDAAQNIANFLSGG